MVEIVIFKVPEGTKRVLKELAAKRGYMGLSDFLRDLVRRELQDEHKALKGAESDSSAANDASKVAELGAPQA